MKLNSISSTFGTILLLILLTTACADKKSKKEASISINAYQVEIIDSLVVDRIGLLTWSDISPDGSHFLAIDQTSGQVLLIDRNGDVLKELELTGDIPNAVGPFLSSRPQFRNNNEIVAIGNKGLFIFDLEGNFKKKIEADFPVVTSLIIQNADLLQFINEDKILAVYGNRSDEEGGFYTLKEGTKLELIDLEKESYKGVLPYPETSKYFSDLTFPLINSTITYKTTDRGVFLAIKNEPKVFFYEYADLDKPKESINLKLSTFYEMPGMDPKSVERRVIKFDSRDLFYGSINGLFHDGENLIISYSIGLSDSEYENATAGIEDTQKAWEIASEKVIIEMAIVTPKGDLIPIKNQSKLGGIFFTDQDGNFWFGPNRNEVELDYEVLYKAKLVEKP